MQDLGSSPPLLFHFRGGSSKLSARRENFEPTSHADECFMLINASVLDKNELRDRAILGIPEALRATFWLFLLGYLPNDRSLWNTVRVVQKNVYLTFKEDLKLEDAERDPDSKEILRRIDMDIPRTMPSFHYFATVTNSSCTLMLNGTEVPVSDRRSALRRILYIYSRLNPGLGYVQGMNEIVAHLYYCFDTSCLIDEQEEIEAAVFHTFQTLMSHLGDNFCRVLDRDHKIGMSSTLFIYNIILSRVDEEVFLHLQNLNISPELYAFRWVTLLMSHEFELPDVLRIWDYFFSDLECIFCSIFYLAVSLVIEIRTSLLNSSFSDCILMLQSYPAQKNIDAIIRTAETRVRKQFSPDEILKLRNSDPDTKIKLWNLVTTKSSKLRSITGSIQSKWSSLWNPNGH